MKSICRLYGKTKQSWYKSKHEQSGKSMKKEVVINKVKAVRKEMPCLGTRKLYHVLQEDFKKEGIKIGRDRLFDILRYNRMLVYKKRRYNKTTMSKHWLRKYPNLIKDKKINRSEELWVSDITYLRVGERFSYLSLITDHYSSKIMGFSLRQDLSNEGCLEALKMAIKNRIYNDRPLIHHSDRGQQYCSGEYISMLKDNNIEVSMTENGNCYENAKAERINGILKEEFKIENRFKTHREAIRNVSKVVRIYNQKRPHSSCDFITPALAHTFNGTLKKRWKTYPRFNQRSGHDNLLNINNLN